MRMSDWSSDVCSSDLRRAPGADHDGLNDDEIDRDDTERNHQYAEEGHHPGHRPPPVTSAHHRHQYLEDIAHGTESSVGKRPRLRNVRRDDLLGDRKSTRLNSRHSCAYRMPSTACKK